MDADVADVSPPTVVAATVLEVFSIGRVGKNAVAFRGFWSVYCEKIFEDDYVTVIYLHQYLHSFE